MVRRCMQEFLTQVRSPQGFAPKRRPCAVFVDREIKLLEFPQNRREPRRRLQRVAQFRERGIGLGGDQRLEAIFWAR